MTIRVLIADDQPLVRAGIAMLLEAEADVDVVGETDSGAATVDAARALRPDVVVMDVRMPGGGGVDATRRIAAEGGTGGASDAGGSGGAGGSGDAGDAGGAGGPVQVLVLTTYDDDSAVRAALRAGAAGFLLKHAAPEELVRAVRAVAAGDGWLDPAVTRRLIRDFAAQPEPAGPTPTELASLTAREREVLVLVALGMSNAEIADHLTISEVTVKTHLGRILVKLSLRDRAQAVAAAYQTGLLTPGTRAPQPSGTRGRLA